MIGLEVMYDIIVFDISGITIYKRMSSHTKTVSSLLSAIIGISWEMDLGSATTISFEYGNLFLFNGIRNPTLFVAIFSETYDLEIMMLGEYIIQKLDRELDIDPGFIKNEVVNKVEEIVNNALKVIQNFSKLSLSDLLTMSFKGIGILLSTSAIRSGLNIGEFFRSPYRFKKNLIKFFGEGGSHQILLKMFRNIEQNFSISLPEDLIKSLINCDSQLDCKVIMRRIVEKIIDEAA